MYPSRDSDTHTPAGVTPIKKSVILRERKAVHQLVCPGGFHRIFTTNNPTTYELACIPPVGFRLLLFATCRKEEEHDGVIPVVHFPADISEFETEDNSVFRLPMPGTWMLPPTPRRFGHLRNQTPHRNRRPQDYVSKSGTLVFPAGTAAGTIAIDIVIDSFLEEDEAFRVVLTGSDGVVFKDGFQEAIRHHPRQRRQRDCCRGWRLRSCRRIPRQIPGVVGRIQRP